MFDLPRAVRARPGNNSISLTTFRVNGEEALGYWSGRLAEHGVAHGEITLRDGRAVLDFEDPEGTCLSLVDDGGEGCSYPWAKSPIPPEYQARGLGYTMITVPTLPPTARFLTEGLGLSEVRAYSAGENEPYTVHVYAMGQGGVHVEVHVAVRKEATPARYGAGGVHHVALRVPVEEDIALWAERLDAAGYRNSGVVDRFYFRSVYAREPNHVLFELATDEPGFEVDGPLDGDRLRLPSFLEARRAEIEAHLEPLPTTDEILRR